MSLFLFISCIVIGVFSFISVWDVYLNCMGMVFDNNNCFMVEEVFGFIIGYFIFIGEWVGFLKCYEENFIVFVVVIEYDGYCVIN